MSDRPKFETKIFPAHFNDASQGTIVSIVFNSDEEIATLQMSALRCFAKDEFTRAVESNGGRDVTASVADNLKLDGQYTIAAVHIQHKYESPDLAERVNWVTNQLNLAFGS